MYRSDLEVIPAEHVAFIRRCRNYFETQTHIFVHGNYEPALPMHQIEGGKLRWEHLDVIRLRPHCSGKTVVVGHTPQRDGMVLDLGFLVGIDTDCCRAGWLTAFDVSTGGIVQADQSGENPTFFQNRGEIMTRFCDNGVVGFGLASRSSGRCAACRGTGQVVEGGATRGSVPTSVPLHGMPGDDELSHLPRNRNLARGDNSPCLCC